MHIKHTPSRQNKFSKSSKISHRMQIQFNQIKSNSHLKKNRYSPIHFYRICYLLKNDTSIFQASVMTAHLPMHLFFSTIKKLNFQSNWMLNLIKSPKLAVISNRLTIYTFVVVNCMLIEFVRYIKYCAFRLFISRFLFQIFEY